jgi:amidophosphoribosyltransferase
VLGVGVVGFRDPHGIRPLVLGVRETAHGREHAVASESVALDILGFKLVRDVAPGEAVVICADGRCTRASACRRSATRRASSSTSISRAPTR